MRVVIIGSGNVATVLGKIIQQAGHDIIQVLSRDAANAATLAALLNCQSGSYDTLPDTSADIYIFAISDTALYDLPVNVNFGNKVVVHTAGSVSKTVLEKVAANHGVLYPLQSLRKEMDTIPAVPLLIDGSSKDVIRFIEEFAQSLSPIVSFAGDDQRVHLHLAAVVVCNFTNHLYAMTEAFCQKERVDFKMLHPIIAETALRIEKKSAGELQTGPAMRNDFVTIDKHLKMLNTYPALRNIYLKLTDSIIENS